jgi:SAM-dependent methyltransferase
MESGMTMKKIIRHRVHETLDAIFGLAGFQVVRAQRAFEDYIPFKTTIREAKNKGLTVGDYIDDHYKVPGATQLTIDQLAELGVFDRPIRNVLEIGPGSGRYLVKIIDHCRPETYEIYETSEEWRNWLAKNYPVTAYQADGRTLSFTPDQSVDLVHTHKMLYGTSILTVCRYFGEMSRVVRQGGWLVFDLLTEMCLTDELIEKWLASGVRHAHTMTAKGFAISYFEKRGFTYKGGFDVPLSPGIIEYLVFQKGRS